MQNNPENPSVEPAPVVAEDSHNSPPEKIAVDTSTELYAGIKRRRDAPPRNLPGAGEQSIQNALEDKNLIYMLANALLCQLNYARQSRINNTHAENLQKCLILEDSENAKEQEISLSDEEPSQSDASRKGEKRNGHFKQSAPKRRK